nr:MAG TPA: hypothetical protein [Bacteriophage sp.]
MVENSMYIRLMDSFLQHHQLDIIEHLKRISLNKLEI